MRRIDNSHLLDKYLRERRPMLVAAAKKVLGGGGNAEDAVQEAALRALATPCQFDPRRAQHERGFESWFWTILVNVCNEWLRGSVRRPAPASFESLPDFVVENIHDPNVPDMLSLMLERAHGWQLDEIDVDGRTRQRDDGQTTQYHGYQAGDLLEAFQSLGDHDQWLLTQVYLRDREETELAQETGFTEGAIRSRLMTARDRLCDALPLVKRRRKAEEILAQCAGEGKAA